MSSKFIVLEGIDGSGTTTQAKLLAKYLQEKNLDCVLTVEPTRQTVIGDLIGNLLLYPSQSSLQGKKLDSFALQLLFCADRGQHLSQVIKPALEQNKWVICDRYHLSTLAYVETKYRDAIQKIGQQFLEPDLTIFLQIKPEIALERIKKRGESKQIFEKTKQLERIAANYEREIKQLPADKKLVLDSGQLSIEELHSIITAHLDEKRSV